MSTEPSLGSSIAAGVSVTALAACGVLALLGIGLYVFAYIKATGMLGNNTTFTELQKLFPTVWGPCLIGSIMLFIASAIFSFQVLDKEVFMLYVLGMSCLSLGFSFSALAMAVMTKA